MRFGIVRPSRKTFAIENYADLQTAQIAVGLSKGVSHGIISVDLGIVVYEFGLFEPGHAYFAINQHLYAGNAVLYAFGTCGDTIDYDRPSTIMWFDDINAVELAIERRLITRPIKRINNHIWAWPAERPSL